MTQTDDLFSNLQPGSFDGINLPVVSVQLHTDNSVARHKFPHRAGQHIEYTGREPLTGTIIAAFFPGIEEGGANVLWPDGLAVLRKRVQVQKSGKLIIPVIGEIFAKISLSEQYEPGVREGCYATIHFEEDTSEVIASAAIPSALGKISAAADSAQNAIAALNLRIADLGTDDAGNAITSISQYVANLQGNLQRINDDLAKPISQASGLVTRIDELLDTATTLANPLNWEARDALLELRDAASRCVAETLTASRPIRTYVAAAATTVVQIAAETGLDVSDILALNAIEDGLRIDAGDELLVYDDG